MLCIMIRETSLLVIRSFSTNMLHKLIFFVLFSLFIATIATEDDCDNNQDESIATEFKHMAMLGYDIGSRIVYSCIGVLIAEDVVLTTAACSRQEFIGAPVKVRLGISCSHFQYRDIANITVHPEYDVDLEDNRNRSVALVKLENPVENTLYVTPTKLYKTKVSTRKGPIEAAWVRLPENPENLIVVKFHLKVLPFPECSHNYREATPSIEINEKSDVCAYPIEEPQISLGIIHLMKSGRPQPVGIMAGGSGYPPTETYPNIYVRISHYIKWIRDNME